MRDYTDIDISQYAESMHEELEFKHTLKEIIDTTERAFIEYVIGEAAHTLTVAEVDRQTPIEAGHTLHESGFDVWPDDADGPVVSVFFPSDHYQRFIDGAKTALQFQPAGHDCPGVEMDGVSVYNVPLLPEDTGIAVHDDAIVPSPQFNARKPWLVKHPEGVVEIEVDTDA